MKEDSSEKMESLMIELVIRIQKMQDLKSDSDMLKVFKGIKSTVDKIVKHIKVSL